MTRKDYVKFANMLSCAKKDVRTREEEVFFDRSVVSIADIFEEDNPTFDRDRFFKAVYNKEEV